MHFFKSWMKRSLCFPGSNADQFHLLQSSTTAAAVNKLRACDDYLVKHTVEAGRCLDLAFAAGGKSDAARVVDLSYFLDAAHGSEFGHQTLLDRRERPKKLKQPVNPHDPVRIPVSLCLNPTNVNVLWLQQKKQTHRIGATLPVQHWLWEASSRLAPQQLQRPTFPPIRTETVSFHCVGARPQDSEGKQGCIQSAAESNGPGKPRGANLVHAEIRCRSVCTG